MELYLIIGLIKIISIKDKMEITKKEKECEHYFIYLSEGIIMCEKCDYTTEGGPEDAEDAEDEYFNGEMKIWENL